MPLRRAARAAARAATSAEVPPSTRRRRPPFVAVVCGSVGDLWGNSPSMTWNQFPRRACTRTRGKDLAQPHLGPLVAEGLGQPPPGGTFMRALRMRSKKRQRIKSPRNCAREHALETASMYGEPARTCVCGEGHVVPPERAFAHPRPGASRLRKGLARSRQRLLRARQGLPRTHAHAHPRTTHARTVGRGAKFGSRPAFVGCRNLGRTTVTVKRRRSAGVAPTGEGETWHATRGRLAPDAPQ